MLFEWDALQPDHVLVDSVPVPVGQLDRFLRGTFDDWQRAWVGVPGSRAVK